MIAPSGTKLKYAVRLDFGGCTNNIAKYEGHLPGLQKNRALGARRLSTRSDSELIISHVDRFYRALKPELAKHLAVVRGMEKYFLVSLLKAF